MLSAGSGKLKVVPSRTGSRGPSVYGPGFLHAHHVDPVLRGGVVQQVSR